MGKCVKLSDINREMAQRIRRTILEYNSSYDKLSIIFEEWRESWGNTDFYSVGFVDEMGYSQRMDFIKNYPKNKGGRTSVTCTWVSNGNIRVRVPAYNKHWIG